MKRKIMGKINLKKTLIEKNTIKLPKSVGKKKKLKKLKTKNSTKH